MSAICMNARSPISILNGIMLRFSLLDLKTLLRFELLTLPIDELSPIGLLLERFAGLELIKFAFRLLPEALLLMLTLLLLFESNNPLLLFMFIFKSTFRFRLLAGLFSASELLLLLPDLIVKHQNFNFIRRKSIQY